MRIRSKIVMDLMSEQVNYKLCTLEKADRGKVEAKHNDITDMTQV